MNKILRELLSQGRNVNMRHLYLDTLNKGFPGGANGKEPACQCRRYRNVGSIPWVGKIPWRKAWEHTPVFLAGKFHRQRSLAGYSPEGHKESDTTEGT